MKTSFQVGKLVCITGVFCFKFHPPPCITALCLPCRSVGRPWVTNGSYPQVLILSFPSAMSVATVDMKSYNGQGKQRGVTALNYYYLICLLNY